MPDTANIHSLPNPATPTSGELYVLVGYDHNGVFSPFQTELYLRQMNKGGVHFIYASANESIEKSLEKIPAASPGHQVHVVLAAHGTETGKFEWRAGEHVPYKDILSHLNVTSIGVGSCYGGHALELSNSKELQPGTMLYAMVSEHSANLGENLKMYATNLRKLDNEHLTAANVLQAAIAADNPERQAFLENRHRELENQKRVAHEDLLKKPHQLDTAAYQNNPENRQLAETAANYYLSQATPEDKIAIYNKGQTAWLEQKMQEDKATLQTIQQEIAQHQPIAAADVAATSFVIGKAPAADGQRAPDVVSLSEVEAQVARKADSLKTDPHFLKAFTSVRDLYLANPGQENEKTSQKDFILAASKMMEGKTVDQMTPREAIAAEMIAVAYQQESGEFTQRVEDAKQPKALPPTPIAGLQETKFQALLDKENFVKLDLKPIVPHVQHEEVVPNIAKAQAVTTRQTGVC